jgi:carbon monoxide dehydrogenase subunit G
MAVKINVDFSRSFKSPLPPEETFAYFSNLEKAVPANFVGLQKFTKESEGVYHWSFESVKYGGYELQIKFTTRAKTHSPQSIKLESVPQPGDSDLSGAWEFKADEGGTKVTFTVQVNLELPIPFFLKSMATPITQTEIAKLFERYIANAGKAISK